VVVRSGLVAEASQAWKASLASAAFRKRSGDVYTRQVAEDVLGWLGLNRAVNRGDGLLEVNPVVGVRHQALERVVAELLGERFHDYTPPTVSLHLGYVMPEDRYRPWLFGADVPVKDVAAEMVDAIVAYGGRFMDERASLGAVVEWMADSRAGIAEQIAFRRPVGYLLLGDRERAREVVRASLDRLGDRRDLAARRFRGFASAFENRLAGVG
jgi:hypothetical protein